MNERGRLYETGDRDAAMNMAVDELLWHQAADGTVSLRFYGWSDRPALSIGYFQRVADVRSTGGWEDLPVVRRMTGGGAIVHDGDLTYSIALPASRSPRTTELYERVHRAFAEALTDCGVPIDPAIASSNLSAGREHALLCFQRSDRLAVRIRGAKVLGSAQRRRKDSVLIQGSLLVSTSPRAPELLGIEQLIARPLDCRKLITHIVRQLGVVLDVEFVPAAIDTHFEQQARELADQKYRVA